MKAMHEEIEKIKKYVRATNYLSAAQIYLQDNFLLERDLTSDDIKSRLLGHWGTCPGINFVYANLNNLIKKHDLDMMFILGPGHGFPALQANLFLEGSLEKVSNIKPNFDGITQISKKFSWPYGFPSHSNPEAPGVILEGGELGYALSTAYGSILDNKTLITAVLVGDGEAETGPTAGAWHLNKLVDPNTNGAVLPILHVNGYKISGPTIFGRMSNKELTQLFYGYGYEPLIVEGEDIYQKMIESLELSLDLIKKKELRRPMIILKTLKGWTGIKEVSGQKVEGNFPSHQVPAKNAKTDQSELKLVEEWLKSYNFSELFSKESGFIKEIKDIIPQKPMGLSYHALGGDMVYKPLDLPLTKDYAEEFTGPGQDSSKSLFKVGEYLRNVFEKNKDNFRLMSPDETYSNKLDSVFEVTKRAFAYPLESWDEDISPDGRVMEILSEHNLQGLLQGYVLTGRHAVFASYEAFIQIVASMADQYAKFMHIAREVPWRGVVPSLNYLLTSSGWEQEHNGFSHQNPGFINDMLNRQGCFVNVFFPPDAHANLVIMNEVLKTTQQINIIVSSKKIDTNWLSIDDYQKEIERGMAVWGFASNDDPDIVFCGIGDYLTRETLAAINILKEELPDIKVRFVNVLTLTALGIGHEDCRIDFSDFHAYFTEDKPVIINFHGYPQTIKQMFFDYGIDTKRFSVHGYLETGSTTTPFDMLVRNQTSRYQLLIEAVNTLAFYKTISQETAQQIAQKYNQKLEDHKKYIIENGDDPEEIKTWKWKKL